MRSLRFACAAALLILQVARCNGDERPALGDLAEVVAQDHERGAASSEDILARRNVLVGNGHLEERIRVNRSIISADALDGRALIAKWLNPVALEKRACTGTYTASCGDGYCCPTTGRCCDNNNGYCKKSSGDDCCTDGTCPSPHVCADPGDTCDCKSVGGVCCPDNTHCKAGKKCCGNYCTDKDNICCSDGSTCEPGNICVRNVEYSWDECCTDAACTARVRNGVTTTSASDTPRTTAPPKTTAAPVVYQYFYTTIYWSYYYYFYTYRYDVQLTTITSTYTTTTTTLSIYAANTRTASAQLSSMISSVEKYDFTTPARATTALKSTPALPTPSVNVPEAPVLPGVGGGGGDLLGAGMQAGVVPAWAVAWALGAGVVAWGMVWL